MTIPRLAALLNPQDQTGNVFKVGKWLQEAEIYWGTVKVLTAAPAVGDLRVGELAVGDGTESSPSAGSNALYVAVDTATIMVVASDGSSLATRNIT